MRESSATAVNSCSGVPVSGQRDPGKSISEAIAAGHLILEMRARYEYVDQTKTKVLTDNANAETLRTRLGWETGDWNNLRALVEFSNVALLGPEYYQVNVPGATTPPLNGANRAKYPLVNDPATSAF